MAHRIRHTSSQHAFFSTCIINLIFKKELVGLRVKHILMSGNTVHYQFDSLQIFHNILQYFCNCSPPLNTISLHQGKWGFIMEGSKQQYNTHKLTSLHKWNISTVPRPACSLQSRIQTLHVLGCPHTQQPYTSSLPMMYNSYHTMYMHTQYIGSDFNMTSKTKLGFN